MMKLIKNRRGVVANTHVALVVVAILVVAGIGVYFSDIGSTEYWETDTEFGIWELEVYIDFTDGTTESLKIIEERQNKPFAVKYNNKEITYIGINLYAKPTGEGYDGAELIYSNSFGARKIIKSSSGVSLYDTTSKLPDGTTKNCPLGVSTAILSTGLNLQHIMNDNPSRYPNGDYIITFTPKGTVKYRGYPDGGDTWKTASLPPPKIIWVKVAITSTASIAVTLSTSIRE